MTFKSNYPSVEPNSKYGELVSNFFWEKLDHFASRTLFIDFESGRKWTGAEIKQTSTRIGQNLIGHGLVGHTNCVLFYKHNDYIQLVSLGLLFAGASVCVGYDSDPEHEHGHMLQLLKPSVVFVRHELVAETVRHCKSIEGLKPCAIVIMDDDGIPASTFEMLITSGDHLRELAIHSPETRILGLHAHLLAQQPTLANTIAQLPIQTIDPNWPAFILLTSGSTGRPKPAGRSQRNSLYVAHSLQGAAGRELWNLNESSVLLGHLALDHGTGIFQLKQNIALGLTCVLMNGYALDRALEAIRKYQISDICLGSALVHKFLTAPEVEHQLLTDASFFNSLSNLIAVGSSIASQSVVRQFMVRVPNCSIRQAFGMTECGFLTIVPRELASAKSYLEDLRVVGYALPNVEFKLLTLANLEDQNQHDNNQRRPPTPREEIHEPEQTGELYVRGPTVSPGYHGAAHAEHSRQLFGSDGFYKSGDICSFTREGMLRIHGRQSEVLCLYDGWKVLPAEIEQVILEHPLVGEAAVIGVQHPDLRTCHAPRAYVVPREGVAVEDEVGVADARHSTGANVANGLDLSSSSSSSSSSGGKTNGGIGGGGGGGKRRELTKQEIFDFIAGRLSEPKHLVGGIRFMRELPKISIGKVDKKSLRKLDGLA